MRKIPAISAAMAVAILALLLPPPLAAASGHRAEKSFKSQKSPAKRHKVVRSARRRRHSHKSPSANSMRPHPVIYQDASGRVVLETFATLPSYGPLPAAEIQDYPRPPCDPVDAVIEARLHEPGTENDGGEEEASEGQSRVAQAARIGPAGLSRIAEKVGSFFRPKSPAAVVPQDVDLTELLSQGFRIPVEGVDAEKLRDSFLSARGRRHQSQHLAIDIGAPRGTPVLATTDGEVVRITRERRGGKSIYQKDPTGQYLLFYCHLSGYAEDLQVGRKVVKGDVIGYVGSTGHVIGGPHLHFSITRLPDAAASFKQGLAINPYLLFLAGVP